MGVDLAGASGGDVLCVNGGIGRGACTLGEGRGASTPHVGMGGGSGCEVNDGMMKAVWDKGDKLIRD